MQIHVHHEYDNRVKIVQQNCRKKRNISVSTCRGLKFKEENNSYALSH